MLRSAHLFAASFRDPVQRLQQTSRLVAALRSLTSDVPLKINRDIQSLATQLSAELKPQQIQAIKATLEQIDADRRRHLDVERWIKGLEFTADRVGLIFTNSLEHSLHIIDGHPSSLSLSHREERSVALRAFACSEAYFEIRRAIGHSIDSL